MRFLLAPYGSRGDVEPMIALACALRLRGDEVVLAGPPDYRGLVEAEGVRFHPVGPPFSTFFAKSRNELKILYQVFRTVPDQFQALERLAGEADAIVGAMLQFAAPSLAEASGIPYFYAVTSPAYLRSSQQPALSVPLRHPPEWIHRLTWSLQDRLFPWMGGRLNHERRRRALAPVTSLYHHLAHSGGLLAAVDPGLTPIPPDAGPLHATGLWRRPARGELPRHVEEFLNAGPPPLYVGFGSVRPRMSRALVRLVVSAASLANVRVLLTADEATLNAVLPRSCLAIPSVPHELLFPHVRGVVHHGGAGTFASAAVAGRPQGIVAHLGDQHYHGYRAEALGLGPAPLHAMTLTRSRLARMFIDLVGSDTYASNAAAVAATIEPNGADRAASLVRSLVQYRRTG